MKPLLIACASVAWALVAGGCSSSGGAGPVSSPFNPFGTETASATGPEPAVSGIDKAPGQTGQSIAQLCAIDCARIEAACPGAAGANCPSSCSAAVAMVPSCAAQFQAYLACVSTASLTCNGSNVEIPSCDSLIVAVSACANQGGAASM